MPRAGTLWVQVNPSLQGFGQSVRQQLGSELPRDQKIRLDADAKALTDKIDGAKARLRELESQHADPKIDADARALEQAVEKAKARLHDLENQRPDPKLDADAAALEAKIAQARAKLDELSRKTSTPKIEADKQAAEAAIAQFTARLDALNSKRVTPEVRARGIADTEADIAALEAQLGRLDGQRTSPEVRAQTEQARAELAALQAQLNGLNGQRAKVDVDTSGARTNAFSLFNVIVALGPAGMAAGAVAAAGLASVGSGALAGIAGVLSLKAAFSGVGEAIKAYDSDQKSAATSTEKTGSAAKESASRIAGAQQQVVSAERGLEQARAHAADAAVTAAARVADAQRNVVSAHRSAAQGVQSALRQQEQAEESLARSQQQERRAQEDLTRARQDAVRALRDMSNSVVDNALSQRGAEIQLEDALAAQAQSGAAPGSLQGRKDQLAVDEARQQIKELRERGKDLAADKADADRKGINGSDQVVAAQERVTQAVLGTRDAQRNLQDAAAAVVAAQRDGAEKVAGAERQLADARRQQAIQARDNQASIASAQDGVTSAQRGLQQAMDASKDSADGAGKSMKNFGYEMSQLSPAGREFVQFYIRELKPKFDEIKATAQQGLMPGLQQGIRNAFPVFDQLKTIVGNSSKAIGDLATEAGTALTQPFWRNFFDFMGRTAGPTIKTLGETFGNFVKGAAGIMQALYEPVFVPIMNWFKGLSERVAKFGEEAASGKNAGFNKFLDYIRDNGPKLRDLLHEAWELFKKIGEALAGAGAAQLNIFLDVLKLVNRLPEPVIHALVDLFVAYKSAMLIKEGVKNTKDVYDNIVKIADKIKDIRAGGGLSGALGKVPGGAGGALAGTGAGVVGGLGFLGADAALPQPDGSSKWLGLYGTDNTLFKTPRSLIGDIAGVFKGGLPKTGSGQVDPARLGQIGQFISNPGSALPTLFSETVKNSDWFKSVSDKIHSFSASVPAAFSDMGKRLGSIWGSIGSTAKDRFAKVRDDVVGRTKEAWSGVSGWWNRTKDDVTGRATDLWNNAKDRFGKLRDDVTGRAKDAWSGVSGWWSRTKTDVTNRASELWGNAKDRFGRLKDDVTDRAKTTWSGVSDWWSRTRTDVTNRASELWGNAKDRFTRLKDDVTGRAKDAWSGVSGWWTRTRTDVTNRASELWGNAKDRFTRMRDDVVDRAKSAWSGVSDWWSRTRTDVTNRASELWANTKDRLTRARDDVVDRAKGAWSGVSTWFSRTRDDATNRASELWGNVKDRFNRLKDDVINAANVLRDGVGRAFDGLRRATAAPVNWVVQVVYGQAIRGAWGKIQGFIPGLPNLPEPGPPMAFREGGPISGPGTGTSDSIPAWIDGRGPARLSDGEHVWTSGEVDAVGGHQQVLELRRMARSGQLAPDRMAGPAAASPDGFSLAERVFGGDGFALGGAIGVARAAAFATGQVGKPYTWASTGPGGYDCSGLWSAIVGSLLGQNPYSPRRFSTASFGSRGAGGFVPGLGTVSVGVTPNAGDGIGHMAGSIGPLNVESRGGQGVVIGPNARGATNPLFTKQFFFPGFGDTYMGQAGSGSGGTFDFGAMIAEAFKGALDMVGGGLDKFGKGPWIDAMKGFPRKIVDSLVDFAKTKIPVFGGGGGGDVEGFRGVVNQALSMLRLSPAWADVTLGRMRKESGGNPSIVNNWDSNARRGTPSVGLMQVIGPTYRANADPRHNIGPYLFGTSIDPLSNILASMRYTMGRYGSLPAGYGRAGGYDSGGLLPPGITAAINATGQPERILTPRQTDAFDRLVKHATERGTRGGDGVTMNFPGAQFNDPVDADLLMARAEFAIRGGGY